MKIVLMLTFRVVIYVELILIRKNLWSIICLFKMILTLMAIITGSSSGLKIRRRVSGGLLLLTWSKRHLFSIRGCLCLSFLLIRPGMRIGAGLKVGRESLLAVSTCRETIIWKTTIILSLFSMILNTRMMKFSLLWTSLTPTLEWSNSLRIPKKSNKVTPQSIWKLSDIQFLITLSLSLNSLSLHRKIKTLCWS